MAFATSTLLYLEYSWKTKYKEKDIIIIAKVDQKKIALVILKTRKWNSTIPLLRWQAFLEVRISMNTPQSVPFLFSPASYKAYRQNQRSKRHVHTMTNHIHTIHVNYPGIFVSQVLLHNPVFTFGSLWIQIKCLTTSKSILCQFKQQITLLVSCRIRCAR